MLYACENCSYLFESDEELEQCPDCGKFAVRAANDKEIEEFNYRVNDWDDGGDLFGQTKI